MWGAAISLATSKQSPSQVQEQKTLKFKQTWWPERLYFRRLSAHLRQDCSAYIRTLVGTPGTPRGWGPECVHAEFDSSEAFRHLSLQMWPPPQKWCGTLPYKTADARPTRFPGLQACNKCSWDNSGGKGLQGLTDIYCEVCRVGSGFWGCPWHHGAPHMTFTVNGQSSVPNLRRNRNWGSDPLEWGWGSLPEEDP